MAQLFLSPPSHTPAIFKISGDVTPVVAVKPPSRFVRRADGKGFVRRDALRGINRRAMFNLKKKKAKGNRNRNRNLIFKARRKRRRGTGTGTGSMVPVPVPVPLFFKAP